MESDDVKIFRKYNTNSKVIELKEMQLQTIKELKSHNIIVESPTGTGKTIAYLIPILKSLSMGTLKNAIILAPTHELATQIFSQCPIENSCLLIGKKEIPKEASEKQILVATPGKFIQFLKESKFENSKKAKLDFLILDEADKLLERFKIELIYVITVLKFIERIGFFSATICNVEFKGIGRLKNVEFKILKFKDEKKIDEKKCDEKTFEIPENLKIFYCDLTSYKLKLEYCAVFLKTSPVKRNIVFFNTSHNVEYFYEVFKFLIPDDENSKEIIKLHGKMTGEERQAAHIKLMEEKNEYILLCTDLAARGLDFDAGMVLHFDFPKEPMNIIHRCGRTARNKNLGISIIFSMKNERRMFDYLKKKIGNIERREIKNLDFEEMKSFYKKNENFIEKETFLAEIVKTQTKMVNLPRFVNENIMKISVKAFVSFISAYKQHILSYILCFSELDFDSIIDLYFLVRVPNMKELQGIDFKKFSRVKKIFGSEKEKISFYVKKNRKHKKK